MTALRIAIVGLGKIARDRHVAAIAETDGVTLAAVASPHDSLPDLPHFTTLEALLRDGLPIDAVAICTPPQARCRIAATALAAGKHVMLEKPPGTSPGELDPLIALAERTGKSLFAAWHSRHAAAVEPARHWLASRRIRSVQVEWKEDVRVWHPGQRWIFEADGFGVFDPGINALSILTSILPEPVTVTAADLCFPANCAAPIAARLSLSDRNGLPVAAAFDFRQTGPQTWTIAVATDEGELLLSSGGARLALDGQVMIDGVNREYPALYRRFAELAATASSDVDLAPLRLVADAFRLGKRDIVEPFED